MTRKILRFLVAVAVTLLAVGLLVMGYDYLMLGTGLTGAFALLHRWRNAVVAFGSTGIGVFVLVIVAGIVFGSWVSRQTKDGRY
jgi:TRAP-type C4-dicarboxylate transport system permease small subunit